MAEFSLLRSLQGTALLFPGQGSQQVGMAQAVAEAYPAARAALDEADAVLGFALSRLMAEGPEDTLTDTINAQPALLAASIAILRALETELGAQTEAQTGAQTGAQTSSSAPPAEQTRTPTACSRPALQAVYVAGHSMGEYTALVAAGSLRYADGLRLVRERGRLMKEAGTAAPGMMAAILGLDEDKVAAICAEATAGGGIAQVANDNCPGQVVISGDTAGMEAAMAAMRAAGAKKVAPLAVSIAAHSPLMKPAAEQLQAAINATPLAAPLVPVIGNTTAQPLTDVAAIRSELATQLTGSVRWTATLQWLADAGVTTFVEVGPGEVLSGLVKRVARGANRVSISDPDGVRAYIATLVGA
jgi:[acyl-carrier-protein] S-malonyltransferase